MSASAQEAPGTIAIVGGGLAAATCCETLRSSGFEGRVVLIGAEPHLPYERPPLSKGFLMGAEPLEKAFVHDREWYEDQAIELLLGAPATSLNLASQTIAVGDRHVDYDRLLIATGSMPRRLPAVDDSGVPTHYLRSIEDSQALKARLQPGQRLLIIGGGWIGLEVAAAARTAGCEVTVVDPLELPLLRVLGPEVAAVFAGLHREHGVDLRTSTSVAAVSRDGEAAMAELTDGSSITADAVVIGVGVLPVTSLAEEAGLRTDNGIVVDEYLRASHPHVFAAGDVANAHHPTLHRPVRVEHWDNAIEQGKTAARNMLGGQESYARLPYFFSDQFDLGMEYVGNVGPDGYDEVVLRGDVGARVFTAFWLKDGKVLAGMHANDWDATDGIRAVLDAETVDLEGLRDPTVPLHDLAS
jgi:3-phenylpropionate/trans-cinnamate dioxygenase ferredoxin reductase subunit